MSIKACFHNQRKEVEKMKIYLSPENRPAPHGPYTGYPTVYEHDVCCEIAEYEKQALERCGFDVVIADEESTMAERCTWANNNNVDLYQTIHTNAGGGTGAECLYYGTTAGSSYRANQAVYNELVKLYPSKRGLKDGTNYYENKMTNMVSVYPEIAFHDNANDARFLVGNKKAIAEALCKGICAYAGIAYIPSTDNPQTGADYKTLYEQEKQKREKLIGDIKDLIEDEDR